MKSRYIFVEGYHLNTAELLAEAFDLPHYDKNFILVPCSNRWTHREADRYRVYVKWMSPGLSDLAKIAIADVLANMKLNPYDRDVLCNNLEELKRDIPGFLRWYREHRYIFTSV